MNKVIGIIFRVWFVILAMTGNSVLAQNLSWGGVSDLSATLEDANSPQITLSSDGTKATAVWTRFNGLNEIVQSASATISGDIATWSSVTDLSATGQSAYGVRIGLSSDGTKATAVWHRSNGPNTIIQSKSAIISENTATWGDVTTDLSATGQRASSPQITLSSDGTKATAVWIRSNGTKNIIQSKSASIIGNTATWGSVTTDLSAIGQNANNPQIALSSDGTKATAVWNRREGAKDIVQSKSATISENAATWGDVATDLSDAGESAYRSQIGLSSDGTKATAVWYRVDGLNTIIQSKSASISENAATWGSVTDLSATGQDASKPQIGLSSDGTKATAVWRRSDNSNNIIQSKSAVPEDCSYYVIKSINDKTAVICL